MKITTFNNMKGLIHGADPKRIGCDLGGILKIGTTVGVTLTSRKGVQCPVIPPTAILQDIQGPYVWKLDENNIASRCQIARGDLKDDWLVIEKGLRPGDRIVTEGAHRVRKGMKITPFDKARQ